MQVCESVPTSSVKSIPHRERVSPSVARRESDNAHPPTVLPFLYALGWHGREQERERERETSYTLPLPFWLTSFDRPATRILVATYNFSWGGMMNQRAALLPVEQADLVPATMIPYPRPGFRVWVIPASIALTFGAWLWFWGQTLDLAHFRLTPWSHQRSGARPAAQRAVWGGI